MYIFQSTASFEHFDITISSKQVGERLVPLQHTHFTVSQFTRLKDGEILLEVGKFLYSKHCVRT